MHLRHDCIANRSASAGFSPSLVKTSKWMLKYFLDAMRRNKPVITTLEYVHKTGKNQWLLKISLKKQIFLESYPTMTVGTEEK